MRSLFLFLSIPHSLSYPHRSVAQTGWWHNSQNLITARKDDSLMKIKSADSFDLLKRLNEIDEELQDFHISAHKCDLLYKEQDAIKTILRQKHIIETPATPAITTAEAPRKPRREMLLEFTVYPPSFPTARTSRRTRNERRQHR